MVFDEADTYIFERSFEVRTLINDHICICFTATPDNNDNYGTER